MQESGGPAVTPMSIDGADRGAVRQLAASIRERIARGEAKEAIYAELSPRYIEQDSLALLIARVPSPADVQAMRRRNSISCSG